MEEKISSSSSGQNTPRAGNNEDLQQLVRLLQENFKQILPIFIAFLNLLRITNSFTQNNSTSKIDWIDLHDRLLSIPSNHLPTMLGGNLQQSVSDRMTGLSRLELICSRSGQGGKLVLVGPAKDEFVDISQLDRLPIMDAKIQSSEKNKTTSGDSSGFPVKELLAFPHDQIYYMYLNGACLVLKNSHTDYARLNTLNRNPYQGAFKALVDGVFSFSEEAELMQKSIDAATKAENQKNLHHCNNQPFLDLPLYTSFMVRHYLFSLISIDQNLIHCVLDFTMTLEIMVRNIIPELAKLESQEFDLSTMEEFINQVEGWWADSPLLIIRDTIYPKRINTLEYIDKYQPNVLSDEIGRPSTQLQDFIAEIQVIRTIHPPDKDHSEKMTPIHEFSYLLLRQSQQILKEVQAMVKFIGKADLYQVCTDRTSFLYIYGQLSAKYCAFYSRPKTRTNGFVSQTQSSSTPLSLDGDSGGAAFFSSSQRNTSSPPARVLPSPLSGAGGEIRAKPSSANSSPRTDLTSSTSGQGLWSSPHHDSTSTTGAVPKSPRLNSRRSASGQAEVNLSQSPGTVRSEPGRTNNLGLEQSSSSMPGSHSGSTRISPAGSAKQSPNGSARGSPRDREVQRFADQAAADVTGSKFSGNRSLRRKSMAKSAGQNQQVTSPSQTAVGDFSKK